MTVVTIDELGLAIAYQLRHYDPSTNSLPREASKLIDIYGSMNYHQQSTIDWNALEADEAQWVRDALLGAHQLSLQHL